MRVGDAERFRPELAFVSGTLVAALASIADGAPSPTATALRDHERIAARVHDHVPSLPARFGVHYDSTGALASALSSREAELAGMLAAVGDQVELSIVLTWRSRADPATPEPTTGHQYLFARAAREREERKAESLVDRLVGHLACDRALTRQSICPRDEIAATVAVLVGRDGEMSVRERADLFGREADGVSVAVYGPMPPYSFAS